MIIQFSPWWTLYDYSVILSISGVFVMGPGKQGILFEHREKEFGDAANLTDVLNAVKKI